MVTVAKLLTKNQADDGVKYLLSYSITWGQYVSAISSMFGVDTGKTLQANGLSEQNFNIYPFTTLLVPLQNSPSSSQIVKPPPPSSQQSPPRANKKRSVWIGSRDYKLAWMWPRGLIIFIATLPLPTCTKN